MSRVKNDGNGRGRIFPPAARFILLAATLAALIAGAYKGFQVYRMHGPVKLCDEIPIEKKLSVKPFTIDSPEAPELLGYKSDLACPEAKRSFVEWYAFRIYAGDFFIDGLIQARETGRVAGITGFSVWSAKKLKPLMVSIEETKNISWAKEGCDVRFATMNPEGVEDQTRLVLHTEGEHEGEFELRVTTEDGVLDVFIEPKTPGFFADHVGADPTRPTGWFQYLCVMMMGEARGTFTLRKEDGEIETYNLPVSEDRRTRVYLEHMWGQMDRPSWRTQDRYCWEWGTWGYAGTGTALMFVQDEGVGSVIQGAIGLSFQNEMKLLLNTGGEGEHLRVPYFRLVPDRGMYYPQEMSVWAFKEGGDDFVIAKGFLRNHFYDWLSMDLWGRAKANGEVLDLREEPLWTVMDFYKGAQKEELYPEPTTNIEEICDAEGCRISWDAPKHNSHKLEYWVFRTDTHDWTMNGIPEAVVPWPPEAEDADSVDEKPSKISVVINSDNSTPVDYIVVPVKLMDTMLHERQTAGYPRGYRPAPGRDSETLATRPEVSATGVIAGSTIDVENTNDEAVKLVHGSKSNTSRFALYKKVSDEWAKTKSLRPVFSDSFQVQSYDAARLEDGGLVITWSERTKIMGSDEYTSWEVFAAVYEPGIELYRIITLSMSEYDSLSPSFSNEDSRRITWTECDGNLCEMREVTFPIKGRE